MSDAFDCRVNRMKVSPFAQAFATAVRDTQGDIQNVFDQISSETKRLTNGEQTPWMAGSFGGKLILHNPASDINVGILRLIVFDASRSEIISNWPR